MFFEVAKKGGNKFWQYFVTIILVIVGAIVGQIPLLMAVAAKMAASDPDLETIEEFQESMDFSLIGLDPNLSLVLMLLTFIGALLMVWLGVRKIHDRTFLSVLTSRSSLDWSRVFWAFGIWTGLTIVLEVLTYLIDPGNYSLQFELKAFIPLLLIALFLLPFQTSFEEILFRGYLMQGLGLWTKNRLFPLLVTSILFGAMHFMNPEIKEFGLGVMMTYYISIGLFLGICTLMDDGMELALGIHAATNIYGATVVSFAGSALQTPAIFRIESLNALLMLIISIVCAAVFIFMAARKYQWNDWTKLYGKIVASPVLSAETIDENPISDTDKNDTSLP